MGDPTAEVDVNLLLGRAPCAFGVGRTRGDVLGDRAALGLVGVQQRRLRPAAQHPGELPAQVEAVM
jgi:hypothetical protein